MTPTWLDWSSECVSWAVMSADRGTLSQLADLFDVMLRDERIASKMDDRALGLLALPEYWEGDSSVIDPASGEPGAGRWQRMAPESVCAEIVKWGLGMGICPAKKVWLAPSERSGDMVEHTLEFWHPRLLTLRTFADGRREWWISTQTGPVKITPGSDWILFQPYGTVEPWRRGLVNRLAQPWIMKVFANEDLVLASEMTPALVAMTEGLGEEGRQALQSDLNNLGRRPRIVIDTPTGTTGDLKAVDFGGSSQASTQARVIEIANDAIEIAIVGQTVTTSGTTGFGTGNVNAGVARTLVTSTELAWSTCMAEQVVSPWLVIATGKCGDAVPRRDPTTVEERKAQAEAATALTAAIPDLNLALAATGECVDVPALVRSLRIPTTALPDASTMPGAVAAQILGDDAAATAEESTRMANDLTAAGYEKCPHGKANNCRICGVAASYAPDGAGGFRKSWRSTRALVAPAAPAPAAASGALSARAVGRVAASSSTDAGGARGVKKGTASLASSETRRLLAKEPPREVQLFVWGENVTDKGVFILDKEGAQQAIEQRGDRRLMWDLEHRSLKCEPEPEDQKPYGYSTLVINEEGLAAIDTAWQPCGDASIRAGDTPYASPAFDFDALGRIIHVVNVALTALPAMHSPPTLVAASAARLALASGGSMAPVSPAIAAQLGPYLGVDPAEQSEEVWIAAITAKIASAGAPAGAPAAPPPAAAPAPVPASAAPAPAVQPPAQMSVADAVAVARLSAIEAGTAQLNARLDAAERAELIRAERAKIPDALMTWAQSQPLPALRAYLSAAPPIPGYQEALGERDPVSPAARVTPTVKAADAELSSRFRNDPERVARIRENLNRTPDERRRATLDARRATQNGASK
jgi:phage I-like protein